MAGESAASILVNSSAKLLTSNSWRIFGTNGAGILLAARSSQFIPYNLQVIFIQHVSKDVFFFYKTFLPASLCNHIS
jgi:hypothetical protein